MPKLLFSVGESSGDQRAAALLAELRAAAGGVEAFGMGGPALAAAGCRLTVDNSRLQVMGFVDVLRRFGDVRRAFRAMTDAARRERPAAAVLVDYPGFNLRLAARLRAMGVKVVYYVSPQVWAWAPGRAGRIARLVDRMLVLFPFEAELYGRLGASVEFVGHPLADELPGRYAEGREALRGELGAAGGGELLALLPGSRPMELAKHLEVFAAAAALVRRERPGVCAVVALAEGADGAAAAAAVRRAAGEELPVLAGRTRQVLAAADLAVAASGTATLEAALLGCPLVVCYRTGWLNYALARLLVNIPCVSLANVVAGRAVVPELWQGEVSPRRVAGAALALLADPAARSRTRAALAGLRGRLLAGEGPEAGGASRRAARAVLAALEA